MPLITPTIVREPNTLEPVNGNIWYQLNATGVSSFPDYKYVIDLWQVSKTFGITFSKIGRFKIPTRPDNYYGWLNVGKALKPFIENNLGYETVPVNITTPTAQTDLYTRYQASYGFEYNPNISYYDIVTSPGLGFITSTNQGFQVGDSVTINKTNNTFNSQYNGVKVIASQSSGAISIPGYSGTWYWYGFSGTPGISYPISYDGGKIVNVLRVTATSSSKFAYNGTRQYDQRNFNSTDATPPFVNFATNYMWTSTTSTVKFLSNWNDYGQWKRISTSEYETMNIFVDINSTVNLTYELETFDSSGSFLSTTTGFFGSFESSPAFGKRYYFIPCGTSNIDSIVGSGIFNNVTYYTWRVYNSSNSAKTSEKIYRQIDRTCTLYTPIRVVFLNRMGGYDYFTFTQDNKKTVNVNRTEFKKVLDPEYNFGNRGDTVLAQDVQYTYTLNSNWITENEYNWLEELITSPEVYYITTDYASPRLAPIIITDTSYTVKTALRDKLFNLTINYKLSYPINVANY